LAVGNDQDSKINQLLDYYKDSLEFYLIRRLYGIMMLLIILSIFYPSVIDSNNNINFIERIFKGLTLVILSWRAMNFQLLELWIIPEGKLGRFYNVLLPLAFIVGIYQTFKDSTTGLWLFFIALVSSLYWLKLLVYVIKFRWFGTYYFNKMDDDMGFMKALTRWNYNVLLLWILFLLLSLVDKYYLSVEPITRITIYIPFIDSSLGSVNLSEILALSITIATIVFYSLFSHSHYYADYLDELNASLRENVNVNPWLLRTINRK